MGAVIESDSIAASCDMLWEVDKKGMSKRQLTPFLFLDPCQLFSDVAYKARNREDLIAGIDEFLDEVIVLPPGEWDPNIRIEPPKKVTSADKRCVYEWKGWGWGDEGKQFCWFHFITLCKKSEITMAKCEHL